MRLHSLPHSDFTAGSREQSPLQAGAQKIAVSRSIVLWCAMLLVLDCVVRRGID